MIQRFSTRLAGVAAKTAAVAGLTMTAAGGVLTLAPAASASHACDDYVHNEICFYRNAGYGGASRAFTNNDTTYTNDNYTGTSVSLNNTISSYINRHWDRGYTECRYVSQEGCTKGILSLTMDGDLTNNFWAPCCDMNDTFSSHVWFPS
ncbi:peptidase inhibitor family I36 protein [Actinomadura rudentiformis]|uniref:peptidase inhibitor family I36 protein n=1 Tax=Actinomadura rudentiformis TaxID=359158 RepID=UPI00178C5F7F|nr:peptidase inhibitor family I36 protein [Actinomadura rudentiformis]